MKNNQFVMESIAKLFLWFAPITGFPFFKFIFRESSGEGLLYVILLATPIILLHNFKGYFVIIKPIKILGYVFLCSLIFIFFKSSHLQIVFQGRTGFSRYLPQIFSFLFVLYSMIIMSNVFLRIPFEKLLSFIIKGLYIQIFIIYIQLFIYVVNINLLNQIYENLFGLLIEKEVLLSSLGRPHGLSKEPSHLAIYILLCWPFYLLKNKFLSIKTFLILIAIITLQSRSLSITILLQSLAFYIFSSSKKIKLLPYFNLVVVVLLVFFLFGDFFQSSIDIQNSGSTYTRFVALYSAFKVFLEFPISGAGFGLTCFFSAEFFDDFGLYSNEVRDVVDGVRLPFIHNMHIRILSDLGFLGFLIWLWFIFSQVRLYRAINKSSIYRPVIFALGLVYPLIFFTKENIAFMNIWLYTVVLFCLYFNVKKNNI